MFVTLPVDQIDRNPDQPRKHFDQEKLEELAASIAANGLLEPVIVRQVEPGRHLLIAGERRWRACQIANVTEVPARVLDVDEVQAYVLSIAENVNRDDMTVMEEAESYDQLRRYGKSVEEIAAVFGKRVSTVRERLSLVALDPMARRLVEQGVMGPLLAYNVSCLAPGNQRHVTSRFARGDLDQQQAIELANALWESERDEGFFDLEEPTEEQRMFHVKHQRQARSMLDEITRLSARLYDLAGQDPAALAAALGSDTRASLAAIEDVARLAGRAKTTLRKAQAHAEARALVVKQ